MDYQGACCERIVNSYKWQNLSADTTVILSSILWASELVLPPTATFIFKSGPTLITYSRTGQMTR